MTRIVVVAIATVVLTCSSAVAEERGTKDEAVALTNKAVAHINEVGPEQAFKDFSDPKGKFVSKDLYVWCQDLKGDMVAHGANAALVGKNMMKFKDADGKDFNAEVNKTAQEKGEGLTSYRWTHPETKKIEPKESYYKRVGNAICGVGYYKTN